MEARADQPYVLDAIGLMVTTALPERHATEVGVFGGVLDRESKSTHEHTESAMANLA